MTLQMHAATQSALQQNEAPLTIQTNANKNPMKLRHLGRKGTRKRKQKSGLVIYGKILE